MERSLEIRTGESVGIHYELAGLGSRFLAMAVDLSIQVGVTVGCFVLLVVVSLSLGWVGRAVPEPVSLGKTGQAIVEAVGIFAVFVLYFGYFIIFEVWWSGRTPGKRALGLRVVRDAGFPIDVGAAVIRNLIRVLEFSLGFYALSVISALLSRENKRLGDLAAGTIVVRDRRDETHAMEAYLTRETPADDGLSSAERELVERYVARRDSLETRARGELAAQIALLVRPRLRATFDHLSDDELLGHLGRGATPR